MACVQGGIQADNSKLQRYRRNAADTETDTKRVKLGIAELRWVMLDSQMKSVIFGLQLGEKLPIPSRASKHSFNTPLKLAHHSQTLVAIRPSPVFWQLSCVEASMPHSCHAAQPAHRRFSSAGRDSRRTKTLLRSGDIRRPEDKSFVLAGMRPETAATRKQISE